MGGAGLCVRVGHVCVCVCVWGVFVCVWGVCVWGGGDAIGDAMS